MFPYIFPCTVHHSSCQLCPPITFPFMFQICVPCYPEIFKHSLYRQMDLFPMFPSFSHDVSSCFLTDSGIPLAWAWKATHFHTIHAFSKRIHLQLVVSHGFSHGFSHGCSHPSRSKPSSRSFAPPPARRI